MYFLINASEIKAGGGLQVTDSICCELNKYNQHFFVVVLSSFLKNTGDKIETYNNVKVLYYDCPKYNLRQLITGRNVFLDELVACNSITSVLSVFGPSIWTPKCTHICGFARAQLLIPESPYYKVLCKKDWIKEKIYNKILFYFFKRCSSIFFTENPFISRRLQSFLPKAHIETITNNFNQVYVQPERWINKELPKFDGITILCISSASRHKNLSIAIDIAKYWRNYTPDFKFRFVFTIDKTSFPSLPDEINNCFQFVGKVDVSECPSLYNQCDIVFQPSLLECFTATYPEAMIMGKPIVTTDLDFARGLCGHSACYYSPLDATSAAKALYRVAMDKQYVSFLVQEGKKQLLCFDTYSLRAKKIISLLEQMGTQNKI